MAGWQPSKANTLPKAIQISTAVLVAVFLLLPAWRELCAQEFVRFPSLDGMTELSAHFLRPAGSPPYPAVVLLHGCSGLGTGGGIAAIYAVWARTLNESGYAVLLVDSALPRGFGETCNRGPERSIMYRDRPKDAYGALAFLQAQPYVRDDAIGLLGWSQGGAAILLTVVRESVGRPDPPPQHDFRAAVAFYPGACSKARQSKPYTQVEPGAWTTRIPLLVLQGAADNWTPPAPCLAFLEEVKLRGAPVEVVLYPEALHGFDAPNLAHAERPRNRLSSGVVPVVGSDPAARADAQRRVFDFFERFLKD